MRVRAKAIIKASNSRWFLILEPPTIPDTYIIELTSNPESLDRKAWKELTKNYNLYPDPEEGIDLFGAEISGAGLEALKKLGVPDQVNEEVGRGNSGMLRLMEVLQEIHRGEGEGHFGDDQEVIQLISIARKNGRDLDI